MKLIYVYIDIISKYHTPWDIIFVTIWVTKNNTCVINIWYVVTHIITYANISIITYIIVLYIVLYITLLYRVC